ncbi:hypothetical protein [[Clostridium] hylemonae]|uniref:hypothetical protein n=1 Tax=[Clostridium] hylemonae TaxID=89153 RepID=UPI001FCAB9D1|nr:hypothetical protein [[Clostridium] hylemonae]BDF04069.1 hypothetical protein CE91St63_11310 [[Clostridium] hylemonae]
MKKRCGFRFTKRLLSVALAAALVCQLFGLPVLALGVSDTVGSSGCTHVHNETCGYIQAEEGTPCKHTLGVHDDTCGYSVGTEEIPCDMYCRGGTITPRAAPTGLPRRGCPAVTQSTTRIASMPLLWRGRPATTCMMKLAED